MGTVSIWTANRAYHKHTRTCKRAEGDCARCANLKRAAYEETKRNDPALYALLTLSAKGL